MNPTKKSSLIIISAVVNIAGALFPTAGWPDRYTYHAWPDVEGRCTRREVGNQPQIPFFAIGNAGYVSEKLGPGTRGTAKSL